MHAGFRERIVRPEGSHILRERPATRTGCAAICTKAQSRAALLSLKCGVCERKMRQVSPSRGRLSPASGAECRLLGRYTPTRWRQQVAQRPSRSSSLRLATRGSRRRPSPLLFRRPRGTSCAATCSSSAAASTRIAAASSRMSYPACPPIPRARLRRAYSVFSRATRRAPDDPLTRPWRRSCTCRASSSTPLSTAVGAAVFVPGGIAASSSPSGGPTGPAAETGAMTPGGTVMVAQAAEFVPRRAVTCVHGSNSRSALRLIHSLCSPALSEDAAFYSATGPSAHDAPTVAEVGGYEQAMEGMAQQTPEGLAEYYQHAMDMVRKLP